MAQLVKPPPVFTHPEWTLANKVHYKTAELERMQAERIEAEADRLINAVDERNGKTHADVDKKLEQRLEEIKYWNDELKNKNGEISRETDALLKQQERMARSIEGYDDILHLNTQCLINRGKRRGIDLVDDDVQKELRKEAEVVQGGIALLKRTLEQVNEQIRLNRKSKYNLEKDQRDKDAADSIDTQTRMLSTTSQGISQFPGSAKIEPNSVTPEEWMETTRANIQAAERERVNSLEMRSLVDRVLQQVADDISKQVANTNLALERRIEEVRSARNKLADHHAKVTEEEKKMEDTIAGLERAIESKRKPLELAESRIVTRKQRPNIELCRDPAQYRLVEEVEELQRCISSLEAQLEAANTQLRALTRKRLQLEDEIALRDHALFIDDVECATLRKSIKVDRF